MKKIAFSLIALFLIGCFNFDKEYSHVRKGAEILNLEEGSDIQAGDTIEWTSIPYEDNYKLYLISGEEYLLLYDGLEKSLQLPLIKESGSCTLRLESRTEIQHFEYEITINAVPSMPVVSGIEFTNNTTPTWSWEEVPYATKYRCGYY